VFKGLKYCGWGPYQEQRQKR